MRLKKRRGRNKRKKLFYRFLSLVVIFILLGGVYEVVRLVQLYVDVRITEEQIDELRGEIDDMTELQEGLQDDPQVIEKKARENWGLMKEGNRVYRIVEPSSEEGESQGR